MAEECRFLICFHQLFHETRMTCMKFTFGYWYKGMLFKKCHFSFPCGPIFLHRQGWQSPPTDTYRDSADAFLVLIYQVPACHISGLNQGKAAENVAKLSPCRNPVNRTRRLPITLGSPAKTQPFLHLNELLELLLWKKNPFCLPVIKSLLKPL